MVLLRLLNPRSISTVFGLTLAMLAITLARDRYSYSRKQSSADTQPCHWSSVLCRAN